jgi:hypothetical protein
MRAVTQPRGTKGKTSHQNPSLDEKITALLKSKSGIRLDIGCSDHPQKGFVGMDLRPLPGVDIVWDAQDFPYPLPDDCCLQVLMSHLWEHIEPKYRFRMMDEIWRIMMPDGQLLISSPYYQSLGACQDPSHYTCPNEATFLYFTPESKILYSVYKPKPWRVLSNNFSFSGNLEVIMEAMKTTPEASTTEASQ